LFIGKLIATAHAETLTYGIDAGVGETDNVTLAHDDKIIQTIAVTDFDVDYLKNSQALNVNAKGNFSYLDYLQDAYRNQLVGRFDGNASLALIPQRLTWVFRDDFGQSAIDPFVPTTPNNLQNINTFSTGPELYLRPGGTTFVDFSALATRTQYETTPYTNTRVTGSTAWGLNLSALSSISVNGNTERVLFQNTTFNTDFERTNAFVRYELQGLRTLLSADLGATAVGESGSSTTGALANFKLARKLSPAARLTLNLGREIIDGSTSFAGLQAGATGVVGTAPASNTSENYTSTYGSMGWDYQRNRTTLRVSGRWERDDYFNQAALDRTMLSGEMRLQRQLTRAFAAQITGLLFKNDYANATVTGVSGSPNTETSSIAAALSWRFSRALEVKLACEHTGYAASSNVTSYKENRIFLKIGYRPVQGAPIDEMVPGT
jgi:hypothetical protein